MHILEFYLPGKYEMSDPANMRARTIAAFYLLQGDVETLSIDSEMRRDILNKLMSTSAVNYWLNDKGWLKKGQKIGRVQLLKLTSKGISVCKNSIAGGSDTPTTQEHVTSWINKLRSGSASFKKETFKPLIGV